MFKESIHRKKQTNTPAGRLCGKLQGYTSTANTYAYSPSAKPHAVRRYYNGITNELSNLRWDNNGNLAQQTVYSVNNNVPAYQNMRALFWDEDDRLNLVAGDGYLSYYAYGHDGNRAIKMTGNAAIDQTGTLLNSTDLENITIYPNEYLTVTQAEYTKYYYAGGNRIASKIGTGGFGKMTRLCTLDQSLSYNANVLFDNVIQQIVSPINQPNDEFPVNVCGGYSVAAELLADPLPDFYISQTNLNFTQNNLLQQFRQNLVGGNEAVYFFHSDHLGSASWITNGSGLPVQHLLYLPFGEHFANERNTAYDERFTFTGKEKDIETGYYYFGARFDNVDLGFMSVDPMSDKYPSISPYAYCAWNPIKLVDPEGEEAMENDDWYRNKFGDIVCDETVKSQNDLPKDCTYLGIEGVGENVYGETTRFYNSDGTIEEIPLTLEPVIVTSKKTSKSAEVWAEIPITLSWALYDGPEFGPADLVAIIGSVALGVYAIGSWINEEINTPPKIDYYYEYQEHRSNKRKSTYDNHTKRRPGQVYGENRNNSRGDKNKKYKPQPNPNKQREK